MHAALPPSRDFLVLPLRQRVRWVVQLGSLVALIALTIDLYLPAFPELRDELSTSTALVQLTLTGTLVGLAIGQLVVGPLSDSLGRRTPLLIGLGLHMAASLGCVFAPSIEVLGALRVLQGIGAAASSVTALAVVRDLFDGAGASRLLARLLLILGASPIFAPSIGGALLAVTSWRGIFVVLALVSGALLVVSALGLPETLPAARRRPAGVRGTASTYRRLLGDRPTWGLVLTAGMTNSLIFTYVTGAPFVLQGLYGLDARQFGLTLAASGACFVVGTQVTAQLVRTIASQRLLATGLGGALIASCALVLDVASHRAGLLGVVALLCLTTVFIGLAVPSAPALVLERNAWAAGSAAAMLGCAQFGLGAAVFPLVALLGLRGDLAMGAAIAVGAAVGLVLLSVVVLPVLRAERRAAVLPPRPSDRGDPEHAG